MKTFNIKIHSISDIITNSSSEVFVFNSKLYNEKTIITLLNKLLEVDGREYDETFGRILPASELLLNNGLEEAAASCDSKDLAVTAFTNTTPYWMRVYLGDLDGVDEYDIY